MATLALSSPSPRSRTPSLARRRMPALTRASASIAALASSLPASIAACRRPRLISLNCLRNGLLKPRLGRRRCSGIWPPSKPFTATPARAFWPLTPRPAVLPLPDPMPRPTRRRVLREPGRSAISESFIALSSSASLADHAHEVANFCDHAAGHRRVGQFLDAADLVEAEPDQGLALHVVAPHRAADLLDADGFPGSHGTLLNRSPARRRRRGGGPAGSKP